MGLSLRGLANRVGNAAKAVGKVVAPVVKIAAPIVSAVAKTVVPAPVQAVVGAIKTAVNSPGAKAVVGVAKQVVISQPIPKPIAAVPVSAAKPSPAPVLRPDSAPVAQRAHPATRPAVPARTGARVARQSRSVGNVFGARMTLLRLRLLRKR